MLYVETDFDYGTIEEHLHAVIPSIIMSHVVTDEKLKQLGFVDHAPCVFSLDMTRDDFEDMMDELMQLEVDAFNTPDGSMPPEDDPLYLKYLKYGWLWDMFYNATVTEK